MVPDPSTSLELGFIALVLAVALAVVALVRRAGGPTVAVALGLAAWLVGTYAVGASGLLADAVPPKPFILFGPSFVCALWFALRSRAAGALVHRAPLAALVGLQTFRLPLELLMHAWSREGALPIQMTLAGLNWDIVTGATALLLAPFAARSRAAVLAWNTLGLLLLINIVSIAILSFPGPMRMFAAGPPNVLVMRAPYTWLPAFLVQVALAGHIIVFRALRRPTTQTASPPGTRPNAAVGSSISADPSATASARARAFPMTPRPHLAIEGPIHRTTAEPRATDAALVHRRPAP